MASFRGFEMKDIGARGESAEPVSPDTPSGSGRQQRKVRSSRAVVAMKNDDDSLTDELIGHWLRHVSSKKTHVREERSVESGGNGDATILNTCYFESSELKLRDIPGIREGPLAGQNCDHYFMMKVHGENGEQFIKYNRSGDNILEFKLDDKSYQVPFLYDYTKRWNCRMEVNSGLLEDEIPLVYGTFNLLMSNQMLIVTVVLLVWTGVGQILEIMLYDIVEGGVYQTCGVLIATILGSYVVKGGFLTEAVHEGRAVKVNEGFAASQSSAKDDDKDDPYPTSPARSKQENAIGGVNPMISADAADATATAAEDGGAASTADSADLAQILSQAHQNQQAGLWVRFKRVMWAFFYDTPTRSKAKKQGRETSTGRKRKANGLVESQGFIEVLDMATEYLKQMSSRDHEFVPRRYCTMFLRLGLVLVPFYFLVISLGENIYYINQCSQQGHHGFKTGDVDCNHVNFAALFYLGNTIDNIGKCLGVLQIILQLSLLIYGSDVANALTKYWLHRFRHIRRLKAEETGDGDDGADAAEKDALLSASKSTTSTSTVAKASGLDFKALQPLIERDAYERYLFTHTFFMEASQDWSLYISLCLFISAALFAQSYFTIIYLYSTTQYLSVPFVLLCLVNGLFFSLVFATMAYANGSVENLTAGFTYSGANDYTLIGSRSAWLSYVTEAPIYWYIFGFAIKRSDIASYLGGVISAILGGVIMSYVVGE